MKDLGRSYKEIFCNVGKIKWCAWGHQVSQKSMQLPLTSRQFVSILNHADLQVLTWAFPSELHCLIFFFVNSNLIVNANLPRGDNKTMLAFLSSVLEQQACYEKPTLKALLRVLLWRGEGGGCQRDDEDSAEMRSFIYTAELHLVILIAYRHFFWI